MCIAQGHTANLGGSRSDPCCSVPLIPGCISGQRSLLQSLGSYPSGVRGASQAIPQESCAQPSQATEFFLLPLPGPDPSLPHEGGLILAGTFLAV